MSEPQASDDLAHNLQSIDELRQKARASSLNALHRPIERLFRLLARPLTLYLLLALVAVWVILNALLPHPIDAPPFYYLATFASTLGLCTTILILIVQARQARLAGERAELELQINLLAEQKVAKLIQLVQELRHDLPGVPDRDDPQASAMQQGSDPAAIVSALEEQLEPDL